MFFCQGHAVWAPAREEGDGVCDGVEGGSVYAAADEGAFLFCKRGLGVNDGCMQLHVALWAYDGQDDKKHSHACQLRGEGMGSSLNIMIFKVLEFNDYV